MNDTEHRATLRFDFRDGSKRERRPRRVPSHAAAAEEVWTLLQRHYPQHDAP